MRTKLSVILTIMRELYDIILGFSIIVALTQHRYWKTDGLMIIGLLLVLTGIIEYLGAWMSSNEVHNEWLYNVFFVIEFSFFVLAIFKEISNLFYKRIIAFFYFSYIILVIINIIFLQPITQFHIYTFTFGSFVMVITSSLFLYELVNNTEDDFFREPFFWICTGLLFFYTGNFLLMSSLNYVNTNFKGLAKKLFLITELLSILEYLLFIMAFLCRRIFRT